MMSLLGSYAADCRSQMNVAYVGSLGPNGRGDGKGNQASGAAVDHVSSACLHHHSQSRVVTRVHDGRANRLRAGDIWAYMQPWHAAARSWSLCRLARAATIPIPGTNLGPCPSPAIPARSRRPPTSPLRYHQTLEIRPQTLCCSLPSRRWATREHCTPPKCGAPDIDTWSMGLHNMLLTTSRPTPCPLLASPPSRPFKGCYRLMSDRSKFPRRLPVVFVSRARDLLVQPTPLRTVQQY